MAAKKERGRFSLRFNEGDPIHKAAIELLELQPPHNKAQYVANAVVYYNAHFSDNPQPLKVPAVDRSAIEAIVREIMRQEHIQRGTEIVPRASQTEKAEVASQMTQTKERKIAKKTLASSDADEAILNLIAGTMADFRRNG